MALSKNYTSAYWDVIKNRPLGEVSGVIVFLETFSDFYKNQPKVRAFFHHPLVSLDSKEAVVKAFCKAEKQLSAEPLINLIIRSGHLSLLPAITRGLKEKKDEHFGILDVEISSTAPLTDKQKEAGELVLKKHFQGEFVEWKEKIDAGVLGGFILKTGGMMFNASLKSRLHQLEKSLF